MDPLPAREPELQRPVQGEHLLEMLVDSAIGFPSALGQETSAWIPFASPPFLVRALFIVQSPCESS